ncbi:uncharacterized protein V1518DRAFT_327594 [Limtongia smithiae]|uniref:uncharacterized protein n=1 Tax=Limtongia smithiae TaxID=1125753 RepID=UPI0034CDA622
MHRYCLFYRLDMGYYGIADTREFWNTGVYIFYNVTLCVILCIHCGLVGLMISAVLLCCIVVLVVVLLVVFNRCVIVFCRCAVIVHLSLWFYHSALLVVRLVVVRSVNGFPFTVELKIVFAFNVFKKVYSIDIID